MPVETYPYSIEYYVAEDGKKPFKDWLENLRDVRARAKIRVRIDRVRLGNLGEKKHISQEVNELRIDYGPGYRVYFGLEENRMILLLAGGDKSSQKKDIARAIEYLQDHQRRTKDDK